MTHDRKEQERLRRRRQRREQRQRPTAALPHDAHQIEFPGIMGWMQRNMRWLFLGGMLVLVLSLGAGSLSALNRGSSRTPTPTPSPTATATPSPSGTPTATATPDPIKRSYAAAPPFSLNAAKKYEAVITLDKGGEIRLELFADKAPKHVNNFVFLARNQFFDGLTFHRVLPGFVAQGGDPQGTGFGGPGYTLPAEPNGIKLDRGVISMAKSSAGVSGSQFFITYRATPELEGDFSAFGRVTAGMDVVERLTPRDPSKPNQPAADKIKTIQIIEKD